MNQADIELKNKERQEKRALVPGVVAVPAAEAARFDQRIAEKRVTVGIATEPDEVPDVHPSSNNKETRLSSSKRRSADEAPMQPDVVDEQKPSGVDVLSAMEQDLRAKMTESERRGREHNNREAVASLEDRIAAKNAQFGIVDSTNSRKDDEVPSPNLMSPPAMKTFDDNLEQSPSKERHIGSSENAVEAPVTVTTTANRGVIQGPDLEFGVAYGGDDRDLAVAVAVHEDEDVFIPSAVQYDPDAKPPVYRNRRFRLYALLAFFLLVAVAAGVTIGVVLSNKGSNSGPTAAPTSYRESLGIEQVIARVIGSDALVDPKSPYSKALNWILFDDPMNVTSANSNLVQRFIAAYLYYATTEQQPWLSCNPPQSGEDSSCTFQKLINIDPVEFQDTNWIRWLSNQHECLWAGVLCDDFQQIRGLDLSGANMTGGYPDGLKYFTYLQSLTLVLGQLEGTIPDDWSDYKHLANLELQYNLLSGTIPVGLWQSRVLERVNLSSNRFKGSIPAEVKEATDMKGLYLYENQLTGTIPTELGLLRSIAYVRVNRNALKGTIPTEIGNLMDLYSLRISENLLTGTMPSELGMLTALVDFKVFSNPMLGGTLPDSIYVPSINHFDLSSCNFVGTISSAIANMTLLQDFSVANNHFNGTIPSQFGLFDSLTSLILSGNNFSGSMPTAVCALRKHPAALTVLTSDCTPDLVTGLSEINCTDTCCTLCCNAAGTTCVPTHGN